MGIVVVDLAKCWTLTIVTEEYFYYITIFLLFLMMGIVVVDLAKCWTLTVVTEEYLSVDRTLHQQGVTFLWGEHASHLRETDSKNGVQ